MAEVLQAMQAAEENDITTSSDPSGMEKLHQDPSASADEMNGKVVEFAALHGVRHESLGQTESAPLTDATASVIMQRAQRQIDKFFSSQEKNKAVTDLTRTCVRLLQEATEDTDKFGISPRVTAGEAWRLIEFNIWKLALQDEAADQVVLGNHGIPHIVTHNATVMRDLVSQLKSRGVKIPPGAELAGLQAIIDHDLMYVHLLAGEHGKAHPLLEEGHPLLGARLIREQVDDPTNANIYTPIFPPSLLRIIHQTALTHDSTDYALHMDQDHVMENIVAAVRAADVTHVFWGKLPRLVEASPEGLQTLQTMRLLQTAAEIGAEDLVEILKERLEAAIYAIPNISESEKSLLAQAAKTMIAIDAKFQIPRLCGTKPEYFVTDAGVLVITVEESYLHRALVAVFGQDLYKPLEKAFASMLGIPKEQLDLSRNLRVEGNGVIIQLRKQSRVIAEDQETIPYHDQLIDLLGSDTEFLDLVEHDNQLVKEQKTLEQLLVGGKGNQEAQEKLEEVKKQRENSLKRYLGSSELE